MMNTVTDIQWQQRLIDRLIQHNNLSTIADYLKITDVYDVNSYANYILEKSEQELNEKRNQIQ